MLNLNLRAPTQEATPLDLSSERLSFLDSREVIMEVVKDPTFEWNGVTFAGVLSEVKKRIDINPLPVPSIQQLKGNLRGAIGELLSGATPLGFEAKVAFEIGMEDEEYVTTDLDVLVGGSIKSGILRSAVTNWLQNRPDVRETIRNKLGLAGPSRKGRSGSGASWGHMGEKTGKRLGEAKIANELAHKLDIATSEYVEGLLGLDAKKKDTGSLFSQTVIPDGLLYRKSKLSGEPDLAGFVEVKTNSPVSLRAFVEEILADSDGKSDRLNSRLGLEKSINFLSTLMKFKHGGLLPKLSEAEKEDLPNDGGLPKASYRTLKEVEMETPIFDKENTAIVMRFPSDVEDSDLVLLGKHLVSLGYRRVSLQKFHFTSVEIDEIARKVIARDIVRLRQKNLRNGKQFSNSEVEVLERIMRGE